MSAFGCKADIDEREIDKLIEATKRATSFRGPQGRQARAQSEGDEVIHRNPVFSVS
jgi:hypothetical protein